MTERTIDFEQWAKDLESGEYTQCQGTLYYDGRYCCLGVLAETQLRSTHAAMSSSVYRSITEAFVNAGYARHEKAIFVELNDEKEWSFEQIAQYIRENYT